MPGIILLKSFYHGIILPNCSFGMHSAAPAPVHPSSDKTGGTTISAIHELEERGLRAMLMSAVVTATERSKILRENAKN